MSWGGQGNQGNQGWGQKPGNQGWGQQQGQGHGQQNQGWGQQGQQNQGWGQPGQQQSQGWGQQGQNQGWGQQGQQGQQNQGWGQPGQQNQGWGQQGQQSQGWGQQGQQNQGWGQQGQNQGWGQQGQNQGWGQQGQQHGQQHGEQQASLFSPHQEYIILTALNEGMALDVSGDPKSKGKMILWKKHGEKNQRFKIKQGTGAYSNQYQIFSGMGENITMEVPNNSTGKGVQLYVNSANGTPNEYWQIIPAKAEKNGGYYIKSFCGKCLDVCEQKTAPNTPIIQWDYNGGKNQIWYIRPA